jgi:hypothetical protein
MESYWNNDEFDLINSHKPNKLRAIRKEDIGSKKMGGCFEKEKIAAIVTNETGNTRSLRLIRKEVIVASADCFGEETLEMSDAQRYYERWKYLRKIGISTVSSMRVVDEYTVAMGDMTANGGEFFGKAKRQALLDEINAIKHGFIKARKLTILEKVFMSLDHEEMKEDVAQIQKMAWDAGIRLPSDDQYDLLVNPDGTWNVMVMDLSALRWKKTRDTESVLEAEKHILLSDIDYLKIRLEEIQRI